MQPWRPVLIAVAILLAFGCTGVPSKQRLVSPSLLRGDAIQVRQRLLSRIPIGTPQAEAERLLKSLGLELTPPSELGSVALDSIHCQHSEKTGWFVETTWIIQIDCSNGAVTDIICEPIEVGYW